MQWLSIMDSRPVLPTQGEHTCKPTWPERQSVVHGNLWNVLGIVRITRPDWDTKLGPSDGKQDPITGKAVSFAPTWVESGNWVNLGTKAGTYTGTFTTAFASPVLTIARITWAPVRGQTGPTFRAGSHHHA